MDNDIKKAHYNEYMRLQRKRNRTVDDEQKLQSYKTLDGGGFFDTIKKVALKVKDILTPFSARTSFSPADEKVLNMYGNRRIEQVKVIRTPIERWINTVVNVASLGQFAPAAKKMGYDSLFHLYMLIFVEGLQSPILYEKNSTPRITTDIPKEKYINSQTQQIRVPISPESQLTLKQFVTNAQLLMKGEFWKYTFDKLNCQDFIARSLASNQMLTPQAKEWIVQDIQTVGKTLSPVVQSAFQSLTDLDAYGRKVLGRGL
jgi:hypothetical protein